MANLGFILACTSLVLLQAFASATVMNSENPLIPGVEIDIRPINPTDIPQSCYTETFEMSMIKVHGRLYFTALPLVTSTCPPLAVNAGFTSTNSNGEMVDPSVMAIRTIGEGLVCHVRDKGHFLGLKELRSIYNAFASATRVTTQHGTSAGALDEGNCSLLLVSMIHHLGIEVTPEVRAYLIDGLMQANSQVMGMMQNAMPGGRLRARKLSAESTSATVQAVVDHNIATCAVSA